MQEVQVLEMLSQSWSKEWILEETKSSCSQSRRGPIEWLGLFYLSQ